MHALLNRSETDATSAVVEPKGPARKGSRT
jgi:hypothetical protein